MDRSDEIRLLSCNTSHGQLLSGLIYGPIWISKLWHARAEQWQINRFGCRFLHRMAPPGHRSERIISVTRFNQWSYFGPFCLTLLTKDALEATTGLLEQLHPPVSKLRRLIGLTAPQLFDHVHVRWRWKILLGIRLDRRPFRIYEDTLALASRIFLPKRSF